MQTSRSRSFDSPCHHHQIKATTRRAALGTALLVSIMASSASAQVLQNDSSVCGALQPDPNGGCAVVPEAFQTLGAIGVGGTIAVSGTIGTFIPASQTTYIGRDEDCFRFTCTADAIVTIQLDRVDGGTVALSLGAACFPACPAVPFFEQEIASFTPLEFILTAGDYFLVVTTPDEPNSASPVHACVGYDLSLTAASPSPSCSPQVCPPVGYSTRAFRLTGNPNNVAWSWRIAGPSLITDICVLNVPGVSMGAFGYNDVRAVAKAFELSINGHASILGCSAVQLIGSAGVNLLTPGIAVPAGCSPSPANSTLLSIRVGEANPSCPTWKLYVGPAGSIATCEVLTCTNPCSFNPDIVEIPLSGDDCNDNLVDDIIDLLEGTSVDRNGDNVPDECQGSSCGSGGSCFEPHATPGCSDRVCCETVCGLDPFCCEVAFDAACASLARAICPAIMPGDLDRNGAVNGGDLAILLGGWGTASGDVDGNGVTDAVDLGLLLGVWTG
jgi:hypothetical protein